MFESLFAKLCVAVGLLTAGGGQGTVVRPAEDDREEKRERRAREAMCTETERTRNRERRQEFILQNTVHMIYRMKRLYFK